LAESLLNRNLNLKDQNDRDYLVNRLQSRQDLPLSIGQIKQAVDFLCIEMDAEWLNLYPFYSSAHASIRVGPKLQHAVDLFLMLRLALALDTILGLAGSRKILKRISSPTYERLSTMLEVFTAARYKLAGYDVELEPQTERGLADFRVRYQDEWIYFECKKENPAVSKYLLKNQQYVNDLVKEVLSKAESKLPVTHRIDIMIEKKSKNPLSTRLADAISDDIDCRRYNLWRTLNGIRFAVNDRQTKLQLSGIRSRLLNIKVGTTPTQLSETNAHIQVVYDPYGSKDLQKVRRLVREARDQLPSDKRSIIVLETDHPKRMVSIAEEKFKQPGYGKIIVILVVGNGAWSVPNPLQSNFPMEFVKTAVLPNPI
jgi:hypothetical protein